MKCQIYIRWMDGHFLEMFLTHLKTGLEIMLMNMLKNYNYLIYGVNIKRVISL